MSAYNAYLANPTQSRPQETWTFTYDAFGRQHQVVQSGGVSSRTTTYSYDGKGRLTNIASPQGNLTYQYYQSGKDYGRKEYTIIGADPTHPDRLIGYSYDDLGRLKAVSDDLTPNSNHGPDLALATNYQYDLLGKLVRADLPNGVVDVNTFNDLNQLTKKVEYKSANDLSTNNELAAGKQRCQDPFLTFLGYGRQ